MSGAFKAKFEVELKPKAEHGLKKYRYLGYAIYPISIGLMYITQSTLIGASTLLGLALMESAFYKMKSVQIKRKEPISLETEASKDAADIFSNVRALEQACLYGTTDIDTRASKELGELLKLMNMHEDNKHILSTYLVAENYAIEGILRAISQGVTLDNAEMQLSLSQLLIGIEHAKLRLKERVEYNLGMERKVLQEVLETKINK